MSVQGVGGVGEIPESKDLDAKSSKIPEKSEVVFAKTDPGNSSTDLRKSKDLGEVILLVGGSSAGKSTLISAIRKKAPNYQEKGMDLAFRDVIIARIQNANPDLHDQLRAALKVDPNNWSVPNAVWDKNFNFDDSSNFNPSVTSQKRQELKKACEELRAELKEPAKPGEDVVFMLDSVLNDCLIGTQNVIDLLNIDDIANHALLKNHKIPIKIAIVYCPFSELSERIQKRNEGASAEEKRPGLVAYHHYAKVFKRKEHSSEETVETLNLEECKKVFKEHYNGDPNEIDEKSNQFLEELGFNLKDPTDITIEMTPRLSGKVIEIIKAGRIMNPVIVSTGKEGLPTDTAAEKILSD